MRRLTIRARLTLLWGGLFLAAGAVLLGLTYLLVEQNLQDRLLTGPVQIRTGIAPGLDPAGGGRSDDVRPGGDPAALPDPTAVGGAASDDRAFAHLEAQARELRRRALNSLLTQGAIALGLVGVIGMGFGWLIAERALRPLQRITETARRVADRNLHERIALGGPRDEITELADTFDSMLERLDRAFDSQRRFVGNASHELRTPLAINRTLVEVALGRPGAPTELRLLGDTLLAVNDRQERLLDGLLTLARSEQELTTHDPVDLADVAVHVLDLPQPPGVTVRRDLGPAPTTGDPVLLERVAQNLVQNATAYNVPDGWVSVRTRRAGDRVELTVTNTGPVVPAYEVAGLFEPFRRLRDRIDSAAGTGLGLSIVRSVSRAHGGTVDAVPREGGGLVVRVSLPADKN